MFSIARRRFAIMRALGRLLTTVCIAPSVSALGVAESEIGVVQPSDMAFCKQGMMSMSMFMKGFKSILSKDMPPCISYFVQSWVLDDAGKFKGAMIYSFLLGLLTQGLTVFRVIVTSKVEKRRLKKYLLVSIYVLQVLMGYVLMFLAMTYSVELLLSTVVGVAFGYYLFHKAEHSSSNQSARNVGLREPLLVTDDRPETA